MDEVQSQQTKHPPSALVSNKKKWRKGAYSKVAPITTITRGILVSRSALINDEMRGESFGGQKRRKVVVVHQFVTAHLYLVSVAVVVADVGGDSTDSRLGVESFGIGKNFSEDVSCGSEILSIRWLEI